MMQNTSSKLTCLLVALLSALGVVQVQAQSTAVTTSQSGSKVFLEINAQRLRSELDSLMIGLSSYGAGDWNAILTNGTNPGMDVNFSGYDATGLEDVVASGTLSADSLVLNKDASITGRLTISGVTTVNDSLKATGYVSFSDSLEVVRAVSIGESLLVTGVTSLGDSLHVVGNVDLDAMLNVSGEVTLGSSLVVTGVTTMNDSLNVNGNAEITGTLGLDSLSVTDVINGQVNSLGNFTSDALLEGDSNLYFSAAERMLLASLSNTLDSLIAVIDGLGGASETDDSCVSPVTYQGYDYATVQIGSQCWFAENLRSTNYNDESVIPSGLNNAAWTTTTDGAMTVYDEGGADEASNLANYGRLYNWYAVNTGKLCPSGWHVPTSEEWMTLLNSLGGNAGDAMKSSASDNPAWNGSNSSGFSGLPGGARYYADGNFYVSGIDGYWWSSTSQSSTLATYYMLSESNQSLQFTSAYLQSGNSVRCLKDAASSASVPTVVTDPVTVAELSGAILNGTVESDGGDAVTATGFRWGAQADLSDAADLAGDGTSGAFTALLSGLTASTTYYFTAFATNAEGTAYGDTLSFETASPSPSFSTCGDDLTYQGYDYATVEIGSQCWFAENLQSTKYNDEATIQNGLDEEAWSSTTDGASAPPNGDENNVATHGLLYNWHAVNTGKLCPTGWHVPSNEEWTTLIDGLGGAAVAGSLLKATASDSPGWNGTNDSGFSGLAAGMRRPDGGYQNINAWGYWWSTSLYQSYAYHCKVGSTYGTSQTYVDKAYGNSVRCLKDAASSASVPTVVTDPVTVAELSGAILNGTVQSDGGDAVTATGFRWGAQADLSDAADLAGDGTSGAFTALLSGLTASTTYYFTAFATNAEGTAYGDTLSFETASPSPSFSTCGDDLTYQGYDYATVEIGSQCWFAENLQSTKYNDDEAIPSDLTASDLANTTEGAVMVYSNDEQNVAQYGRLYNWYAVETSKLCPQGWSVPTESDWSTLFQSLGGASVAGEKMKVGSSHVPSWDGTNSSGFSGLPAGAFEYGGGSDYYYQGSSGFWWSASNFDTETSMNIQLADGYNDAFLADNVKYRGFSVRCLKDAASSASVPTVVTDPVTVAELSGAILNGTVESDGGDAVTATGFRWGAQADLSDAADLAGDGTSGAFTAVLSGLTASTTYYFTAFATNAEGTAYGDTLSFETASPTPSFSTCGDDLTYQGYDYATVEIGSLCWFAENLRSTAYNDDEAIPSGLSDSEWSATTEGAVAVYDEGGVDEATNLEDYGRLYNWYAVNTGNLCPSGWRVASNVDLQTFQSALEPANPGSQLKASSDDEPAWDGTNESGFSGLPGGIRIQSGAYFSVGEWGYWWTTSSTSSYLYWYLNSSTSITMTSTTYPQRGMSVRCVQDAD